MQPLRNKGLPPRVPDQSSSEPSAERDGPQPATPTAPAGTALRAQLTALPVPESDGIKDSEASTVAPLDPAAPPASEAAAGDNLGSLFAGVSATDVAPAESSATDATGLGRRHLDVGSPASASASASAQLQRSFNLMDEPRLTAAPASLFTAGLDGVPFPDQVAMVRQRAALEHQRLSEGHPSFPTKRLSDAILLANTQFKGRPASPHPPCPATPSLDN